MAASSQEDPKERELPDHISRDGLRQAAEIRDLLEGVAKINAPVADHAGRMLRQLELYEDVVCDEK